jgi:hypothetical protein
VANSIPTISARPYFTDALVFPHKPKVLIYYCGSNDLNGGVGAQDILGNFTVRPGRYRPPLHSTHFEPLYLELNGFL